VGDDLSRGSTAPETTAAEEAAEAIRLVLARPQRARTLATSALRRAQAEGDPDTASTAERALGLAAKEFRQVDLAVEHLERAIEIAERADLGVRGAEARMSLSLVLTYRGDAKAGLREADRAARVLRGEEGARLQMQRAVILQRLGRLDEALDGYRRALIVFRRNGDRSWQARLLNNRALLHAYRGSLAAADDDLAAAERLHLVLGQEHGLAEVRHNRGFVASRRGDVPGALSLYDQAIEHFRANGVPHAISLVDRCQLLLSVHLVDEARRDAERAVAELASAGMAADLAEARLMLAEAALLGGDAPMALREATAARKAFARQGRAPWRTLASYAALRAAWATGDRTPALLASARRLTASLADAGWPHAALDAGVVAGLIALERGRPGDARADLERAAGARGRGPVEMRVRAWHAEALLRHESGRRQGVSSALRAGLRLIDRHRAALGATELRVHVSTHAQELASFGLRVALERGDPAQILAWSERRRAGGLWLRPVRPPEDALVAADLEELRRRSAEADEAALAGRDTRPALRRQVELEASIRRRSWQARGDASGSTPLVSPPGPAALAAALGECVLVEYVQDGEELHAVTLRDGAARTCRLGAAGEAAAELASLRFSLRRLARGATADRFAQAAAASAAHAADRLDALLLAPLAPAIGDRPLVIVPTGPLHALPWALLPSAAARALAVTPSAALWLRASAHRLPRRDARRVVLVAGPGLEGAEREVAELAARYPAATVLAGADARADAVRRALDGAALAHVAAHGRFRADNPLFSSLTLADGPLTVYDLESLRRAPHTLVLSACESGLSDVRPGDELMGLAAALFSLGTATVVGSVSAIPDDRTAPLMTSFHRRLASGASAAVALAEAQAGEARGPADGLPAARGFIAMGAG
jgi:tetratricopeptide (TPR) repeat protein